MNFRLLIVPPAWQRIQAVSSLGKLGQLGTPAHVAWPISELVNGIHARPSEIEKLTVKGKKT